MPVYKASPPTLTDQQITDTLVDAAGRVLVAGPSGSSANQVQGTVAHDGVDADNPVGVGGIAFASGVVRPAVSAAGDRVRLALTMNGATQVSMGTVNSVTGWAGGTSAMLAMGDNGSWYPLGVVNYLWNGSATVAQAADTAGNAGVVPKPATTGGLSIARLVGATNGVIKASAGQLYGGTFTNTNAAIRYLHLYNKATAGTLSTDTPALTIPLPPNVSVMVDFSSLGAAFATGISWQFTTDDIAIPATAGATTDLHGFAAFK